MTSQVSEPCITCGQPSTDDSHIVRRSQGGEETVRMCRHCHMQYEMGEWYVADAVRGWWRELGDSSPPVVPDGFLQIYDREGAMLARRPLEPTNGASTYRAVVKAEKALDDAEAAAYMVSDDDLVLVHEHFSTLEAKAAAVTRRRLSDAVLRMPAGSMKDKLTSVASQFDVGFSTVRRAVEAAKLTSLLVRELPDHMPEEVVEGVMALPYRLVEAIGNDEDPVDAAMHAIAQHTADPNYGTPQFMKERDQRTEFLRCRARYNPDTGTIEHGECTLQQLAKDKPAVA